MTQSYPWYTPYQFAGNKPIACFDLDGLEEVWMTNNCFAPYDLFGSDLFGSYSGDGENRKFGDGGTYRTSGTAYINLNTGEQPKYFPGSSVSTYHRNFGPDYSHKSDSKIDDKYYYSSSDKKYHHLQMHVSGGNEAAAADNDNHVNVYFEKSSQDKSKIMVHGTVKGDRFPANETILNDKVGNALILGVSGPNSILWSGKNAGPYVNLPGNNKREMQKFRITVMFNEDESFKAVEFAGKQYSIEEWNKQFTKLDPKDSNVSSDTSAAKKLKPRKMIRSINILFCLLILGCNKKIRVENYYFPKEFEGNVALIYGDSIKEQQDVYNFVIPADGILKTPFAFHDGNYRINFYQKNATGQYDTLYEELPSRKLDTTKNRIYFNRVLGFEKHSGKEKYIVTAFYLGKKKASDLVRDRFLFERKIEAIVFGKEK